MYKFFVETDQIEDEKIHIIGSDVNHIKKVLRMKKEDIIEIGDKESKTSYTAKISNFTDDEVICSIIDVIENTSEPNTKITIFQGVTKGDKLEQIVQKITEVGASKLVPVDMEYCIGKIKDKDKKCVRLNKVAEAAAKQSKRQIIPKVEFPISFSQLLKEIPSYDTVLVAYEKEKTNTVKSVIQNRKIGNNIAVIIGPEGGISDKEINDLKQNGAISVSLGDRILRTETAPIVITTILIYELG